MTTDFLSGAFMMASAVAGLFFLRFWKEARDRFLLLFALAFWSLTAERLILAFMPHADVGRTWAYLIRLVALVLIVVAILDKNRAREGAPG